MQSSLQLGTSTNSVFLKSPSVICCKCTVPVYRSEQHEKQHVVFSPLSVHPAPQLLQVAAADSLERMLMAAVGTCELRGTGDAPCSAAGVNLSWIIAL